MSKLFLMTKLQRNIGMAAPLFYFVLPIFCAQAHAKTAQQIINVEYNLVSGRIHQFKDNQNLPPAEKVKFQPRNIFVNNSDFADEANISSMNLKSADIAARYQAGLDKTSSSIDSSDSILQTPTRVASSNSGGVMGPPLADNDQGIKKWRSNKRLEIIYQVLNLIDTGETLSCLHSHTCHENNPLFGRNPGDLKLIGIKTAAAAFHYFIYSKLKNDSKTTKLFEYISIGLEGGAVIWNATIQF